jgi:hypothetical protein
MKSQSAGYISGKATCDSRAIKRPRGRQHGVLRKSDMDRSDHHLQYPWGGMCVSNVGRREMEINVTKDLHFRLLVRTAEDDVGGGVYLH